VLWCKTKGIEEEPLQTVEEICGRLAKNSNYGKLIETEKWKE
jgi:hypothetical protein